MKKLILFLSIIFLILLSTSNNYLYSDINPTDSGKLYKIGDTGPGGGYVFYDKGVVSDGWRYLEAAPADYSEELIWGCDGKSIKGATGEKIGTGRANTIAIIKECVEPNIAAKVCANYKNNGFQDWFLPSKDELDLMYRNLKKNGIGNFVKDFYLSSSEDYFSSKPWAQMFGLGGQGEHGKSFDTKVRAIRAFANSTETLGKIDIPQYSINKNPNAKKYTIGDKGPAGGIVFYDKGEFTEGWQYLEVSPVDIEKITVYTCRKTAIKEAENDFVGSGKRNTEAIVKACGTTETAAQLCADFKYGGFDDWFLPSRDELDAMYMNLHKHGEGNFKAGIYMSSSECRSGVSVSSVDFDVDRPYTEEDLGVRDRIFCNTNEKSTNIRPIRAF